MQNPFIVALILLESRLCPGAAAGYVDSQTGKRGFDPLRVKTLEEAESLNPKEIRFEHIRNRGEFRHWERGEGLPQGPSLENFKIQPASGHSLEPIILPFQVSGPKP